MHEKVQPALSDAPSHKIQLAQGWGAHTYAFCTHIHTSSQKTGLCKLRCVMQVKGQGAHTHTHICIYARTHTHTHTHPESKQNHAKL